MRLSVQNGDVIEIEPRRGEIMATIEFEFTDQGLKIVVQPFHMDGGEDQPTTIDVRG